MGSSLRPRPAPGERGAITWVTALILAVLVAAGYLGAVWGPVYLVDYEVKQVVRDFGNQAIKNPRDAELLAAMCQKLRSLDSTEVVGPDGRPERRPTVDVHPQEVTWERDTSESAPNLHVAFEYRRDIHYPLLDVWKEVTMAVDLNIDLTRANSQGAGLLRNYLEAARDGVRAVYLATIGPVGRPHQLFSAFT